MPTSNITRFDPEAIYDDGAVYAAIEVSAATLARARRTGRLRSSRQGRRILYLGRWLLDWLESDSTPTRAKEPRHGD